MTPHTQAVHLAALRAAARLALSAAVPAFVFACGGAEAPDPTGSTGTSGQGNADTSEGNADTSQGDLKSGTPKSVKNYCVAHHAYETTESCCKAEVSSAHFPSDPKWTADPDLRVDAVTRGCCVVLANASIKEQKVWAERGECCPAIGWNGAPSCTPWGPPVPPKMPTTFTAMA